MEVLFEIKIIGSIARVAAVDPVTGTEAIIQCPAYLPKRILKNNAERKLKYILSKKSS
jgi:hypothetical protein